MKQKHIIGELGDKRPFRGLARIQYRVFSIHTVSTSMVTSTGGGHTPKIVDDRINDKIHDSMNKENIRRLTPSECLRLMDVDEDNIKKLTHAVNEKGKQLISDTQLYSLAGNSIVVAALEHIFENLFIHPAKKPLTLFG